MIIEPQKQHSTRGRATASQTQPRARQVRERSSVFGGHQATRQSPIEERRARAVVHVLLPAAPLCRDTGSAAHRQVP
ncbi:hypothetical protein MRX96_029281 [Rhipicephalus microplus]